MCWIRTIEEVKSNLAVTEIKGAYVTDGGYYKDKNIMEAETLGVKKLIMPINTGSKNEATEAVKRRANSGEGKELLSRRSSTVERIISFIKGRLRLRRFKLRGLVKVGCERTFICLAYNMTRYMQLTTWAGWLWWGEESESSDDEMSKDNRHAKLVNLGHSQSRETGFVVFS